MTIYPISERALEFDYRGCGNAWAAVVTGAERPYVASLIYMDRGTANQRNRTFHDHREVSRRALAEIDGATVISGTCSATEFIA
jgi:hypothetical protein